jgi:hypothetical protein
MRRMVPPAVTAVLAALGIAVASGQGGFTLTVNREAGVDVFMGMDRTKTPAAHTGSDGGVSLSTDFLNDAANKPRMALARQRCQRDTTLHIVRAGSDDEKHCKRNDGADQKSCGCDVVGYFIWGENKTFGHTGLSAKDVAYIGGGIGAGTAIILGTTGGGGGGTTPSGGGGTSGGTGGTGGGGTTPTTPTTPTGPVPINVNITVQSDPNGHDPFVKYTSIRQISLVTLSGQSVHFDGQAPWVALDGTVTSGVIAARGMGTVADRTGVLVIFDGAINATNQITQGLLTIGGPGGTLLPNGPILYRIVTP